MAIDYRLDKEAERGYYLPRNAGERLMFITHPCAEYSVEEEVKMVLDGGCSWVQLRLKDDMNISTARKVGRLIAEHPHPCVFCINDHLNIALHCDATAVHLGKEDMPLPDAWATVEQWLSTKEAFYVGATCNTFDDVRRAVAGGASYIGVGPFRYTETKKKLSPVLGLEGYRNIVGQCKEAGYEIPLFAIGGICLEDVAPLMETGIAGIAVSGAIIHAADPVEQTRRFIQEINKY